MFRGSRERGEQSRDRGPSATDGDEGSRLGTLLVSRGLLTQAQLDEALRAQQAEPAPRPLGQILVEQRAITPRQLSLVLDVYRKRPRLGEILVRGGVLTDEQLETALEEQHRSGQPLGQVLLTLGYLTEELLRKALCTQLNIAFIDLDQLQPAPAVVRMISKAYARKHRLVPVSVMENVLTVAMDDPTATGVIEDLQASTGFTVTPVTSMTAKIQRALARAYGEQPEAPAADGPQLLDLVEEADAARRGYVEQYHQSRKAEEIVRTILNIAIEKGASDVHLETLARGLHVRFRIDGVLQELDLGPLQAGLESSPREVVSRVKVLGQMDIAERRRPQDGSFRARVAREGSPGFDFRVSVLPSYYGESVVIRLLDSRRAPRSIEKLGLWHPVTERVQALLRRTAGILLVTGPTGSGKTSTLYAALMTLHRPEIRILTAEDPIEYVYEQFSQSEVNERIGNTFASYMRAFLRHDPEVIMVGEIRDEETAEMAFRAAQTGHLLLSTLHTNDAVGSVTRLLDLRVDANLLTSCLLGVLSQRLVREICRACRVESAPPERLLSEFFDAPPASLRWYRGKGCPACNMTGYRGRMVVAELWVPSEEDIILINKGAPFEQVRESARASTLSMGDDAWRKLQAGRTNLEELIRTLPYACLRGLRATAAGEAGGPGGQAAGPVPPPAPG
jgi:type IV pilus assembly protein PilB